MPYGETKVYFDGSHYIAIPHTTRPNLRRTKSIGETIDIAMSEEGVEILNTPSFSQNDENEICDNNAENIDKNNKNIAKNSEKTVKIFKKVSKKQIFEDLYKKYMI